MSEMLKRSVTGLQFDTLNDDCLIAVFDLLDEIDLVRMCDIDPYIRSTIQNHVVPRRLMDFDKLSKAFETETMLELFGKRLRRMKIRTENINQRQHSSDGTTFDELLRLIRTHCTSNELVELDFYLDVRFHLSGKCIAESLPFFRSVTCVRLYDFPSPHKKEFLSMLQKDNVRSILSGISTADYGMLCELGFRNLQELRITGYSASNYNAANVDALFENHPNLKSFDYFFFDMDHLKSIARHVPNIENISNYISTRIDEHGAVDVNAVVRDSLSKLVALKSINILSTAMDCSDLLYIFDNIKADGIETMEIVLNQEEFLEKYSFAIPSRKFEKITRLKVRAITANMDHAEAAVLEVLSLIKNVKHCTLFGIKLNEKDVLTAIGMMKQLQVLHLRSTLKISESYIANELIKTRKAIQKHTRKSLHPLTVHVYREEYKDVITLH